MVKKSFVALMSRCRFQSLVPLPKAVHLSPQIMSNGLWGRQDKSFISIDQPHHAAQQATRRYQARAGFISRQQHHHHKHTPVHTHTVDRHASSEPEHVHAERGSMGAEEQKGGGAGEAKASHRIIIIQQRRCRWLGGSKGNKTDAES